jgi:uncharacterized membrane protein YedE/YeeE
MLVRRVVLVTGALALVFAITLLAGLRQGLLTLLGLGFGAVLQGCRFGFTTGWRDYIERRNPHGLWAQLLLLALASGLMLPLLAAHPGELVGAVAPLTLSLLLGAFLFGAAMQLTDGCGSGTLYKAGAGSPLSVVVLPTFVLGSFLGASHQPAWVALGGLPPVDLLRYGWPTALALTLAGCALVALLTLPHARSAGPWPRRWVIGAILLALLAALHLIVAGQPWGYGVPRRLPPWDGTLPPIPSGAWPRTQRAWSNPSCSTSPRSPTSDCSTAPMPSRAGAPPWSPPFLRHDAYWSQPPRA